MPRTGGESEKLGNRYEGVWTVGRLLDLADGKVVRLYAQSTDESIRRQCLDLIDEMERFAFYGIDSQLAEHDR